MLKKQKGFSLIELMLVLLLIGMMAAMTVNFSIHNRDRWAVRDTAREMTSTYYQAKQRAARENASIRFEVRSDGYAIYWNNAGAWEAIKNEIYPKHITTGTPADFKINPMGFILDPGILNSTMLGTQTIVLTAPRGAYVDSMTITIYPYGGLRVEKAFK
jgi:prepilin-type N-terminal cleavage/methylation domain-containing protein